MTNILLTVSRFQKVGMICVIIPLSQAGKANLKSLMTCAGQVPGHQYKRDSDAYLTHKPVLF